jgi:hypothetical protein
MRIPMIPFRRRAQADADVFRALGFDAFRKSHHVVDDHAYRPNASSSLAAVA